MKDIKNCQTTNHIHPISLRAATPPKPPLIPLTKLNLSLLFIIILLTTIVILFQPLPRRLWLLNFHFITFVHYNPI